MRRRIFLGLAAGPLLTAVSHPGFSPGEARKESSARRLDTGCPVADPFCTRRADGWYLAGTQHPRGIENRRFSMYFSADLLTWRDIGPVLVRPEYNGSSQANYWAPEFVEHQGKFYSYYTADSFGDPEKRFVRVAQADRITGPYLDSGERLVDKPSIDGHPYFVSPGEGYLFYCGNEGNPHVGQLLVDRFVTPTKLEDKPRKVFPDETVEWEEGPFVVEQSGTCLLFSSAGNWRDGTYHVRVARAHSIGGPWERLHRQGEPYKLLKTVDGQWGPGHNSVFHGPEGGWWICYHAWDTARTGRYPWAAPIRWDNQGYPAVQQ